MGQSQSEPVGFRVVRVLPDGPLAKSSIEPFFDYVMSIEGEQPLTHSHFTSIVQKNENKRVRLAVLSIKTGKTRFISMTPQKWSGSGLFGALVERETVSDGFFHGLRIIEVLPNSEAEKMGLRALSDFVIASDSPPLLLKTPDDFDSLLRSENVESLNLIIFDSAKNISRKVYGKLENSRKQFGMDLASGALNIIPLPAISLASLEEHLSSVKGALRILKTSEGSLNNLEISPFLDTIIGINEEPIRSMASFIRILAEVGNVKISLQNSKTLVKRDIDIVLRNEELGAAVVFEEEMIAIKSGLKILSVQRGSIAEKNGLRPHDYLLGSVHPFISSNSFSEAWSEAIDAKKKLEIFILDSITEEVKRLEIDVNEDDMFGAEIILQPLL